MRYIYIHNKDLEKLLNQVNVMQYVELITVFTRERTGKTQEYYAVLKEY